MNSGFRSQCVPRYRILTEEQIREIHLATLNILETMGVRVLDDEALSLLKDAGCSLKNENIVRIPNWLVEESILSVPSRITLYNRKGKEAMDLGGNKVYFGLGTDLIHTIDLHTGERRPSRIDDVANAARIADFLEEIDFIASYALPREIPTNMMYVECFRTMVRNSVKPIFFTAGGREDLSVIIEMAAAVAGSEEELRAKPFLIHYSEPTSPLSHSRGALKKLFLCAEKGLPVNYTPAVLMGASGPVTLAGAIAMANAEALSGIVLHQLKAKGAPLISGFVVTPMDMLTSIGSYGAPEFRLTHGACSDLYHYYGIPVWGTAGCTDANVLDPQAAMEAAISILTAALEGANLIHDIGYMGQGLIGSPAAILMGGEIISYVKRMIQGFDMDPDRMGLEAIRQIGPGGNFLMDPRTRRLHRQEHWRPKFLNRHSPEIWSEKGAKTYGDVLTERAREILATHKPEALPEAVLQTLEDITQRAERTLRDIDFVA